MPSEKFIMVSLDDEKSKELANVISNDTSRKILAFLSDKEASESDIAKSLGIPPSTVHYNVHHLLKNSLIEAKDFYWSGKGNKVYVYSVAKKLIVIAPKGAKVSPLIKYLIPVVLFVLAAAATIQLAFTRFSRQVSSENIAPLVEKSAIGQSAVATTASQGIFSSFAFWFLAGAFFALALYLVLYLVWREK